MKILSITGSVTKTVYYPDCKYFYPADVEVYYENNERKAKLKIPYDYTYEVNT